MTHDEIEKRHYERLSNYRHSAEYAVYAQRIGTEAPQGKLPHLLGNRWEIDSEIYHHFLEILPPLGWRGGSFYLSEFSFGDVTTKYTREGDKYYCEFARFPETPAADRAVETPWGPALTRQEIAPGIILYSTAWHGGYWLSPERVLQMPGPLRDATPFAAGPGPGRWYEEDCDWAIVALAFPRYFPADSVAAAQTTLKHDRPGLLELLSAMRLQVPGR